jgi:hypothetical protein
MFLDSAAEQSLRARPNRPQVAVLSQWQNLQCFGRLRQSCWPQIERRCALSLDCKTLWSAEVTQKFQCKSELGWDMLEAGNKVYCHVMDWAQRDVDHASPVKSGNSHIVGPQPNERMMSDPREDPKSGSSVCRLINCNICR